MSGVEAYYRAHAREFSYGRVSPLGLNAGSCGFAAMGLAMTLQHAGGVYDVLMAAGILGDAPVLRRCWSRGDGGPGIGPPPSRCARARAEADLHHRPTLHVRRGPFRG